MLSVDNPLLGDIFDILRFIVGIFILSYASYADLKFRKVKNSVWITLGAAACAILVIDLILHNVEPTYILTIIPIIILFMYFLSCDYIVDLESKKVNLPWLLLAIIGVSVFIYQLFIFWDNFWFNLFYLQLFSIMVLILVFYIFYLTRLLHGGADTKAMMALAILVPFYPRFAMFPILKTSFGLTTKILELMFPFALIILFNAVILSIFIPVGFAIYNVYRGNTQFPHLFLGYKMELERVPKKFVWLMERLENGKLHSVFRPGKADRLNLENELQKLKKHGLEQVWVTPQIPFMITLALGYVFAFLIGNIMFLIVTMFV